MGDAQTISIGTLRAMANTFRQGATECVEVGQFLAARSNLFWSCKEASKFEDAVGEYKALLATLHDELTAMAAEVARRADVLAQTQDGRVYKPIPQRVQKPRTPPGLVPRHKRRDR